MSEADLVGTLAADLFERRCTPDLVASAEGSWSERLWAALVDAGLTLVGTDEAHGGAGGGWSEIAAVLRAAGAHAAPVPLAETVIARRLLASAGLPIPDGPLTFAVGVVEGRARRVAYARIAVAIVLASREEDHDVVTAVPAARCAIEPGLDLAREPRDNVSVDAAVLAGLPRGTTPRDSALLEGALCRSIQMAGVLDRVRRLTFQYAGVREQFGRPIARFQAVQHNLALLAGESEAAAASISGAVGAAHAAGTVASLVEIAAAKIRTGTAATEGARLAHQVHGAIGVTYEHQLHHFTSRLWTWRDEFGGERAWAVRLGRAIAGSGAGYWERLTRY